MHPENQLLYDHLRKKRQQAFAARAFTKAESLAKVLKSISRYPLPIHSGSDAQRLAHVGKAYATVIDKILTQIRPLRTQIPPHVIAAYKLKRLQEAEAFLEAGGGNDNLATPIKPEKPSPHQPNTPHTIYYSADNFECVSPFYPLPGSSALPSTVPETSAPVLESPPCVSPPCVSPPCVSPPCFIVDENESTAENQSTAEIIESTTEMIEYEGILEEPPPPDEAPCMMFDEPLEQGLNTVQGSNLTAEENVEVVKLMAPTKKRKMETKNLASLYYENPEVVMLIDSRESRDDDLVCKLESMMRDLGVKAETKVLAVGDICWICRFDETCLNLATKERVQQKRDFMLPWLIERKQISDLYASVVDGRYHTQKARLLRFAAADPTQFICHTDNNNVVMRENNVKVNCLSDFVDLEEIDEPSQKTRESIMRACNSVKTLCVLLVEAESSEMNRALFSSQGEMINSSTARMINMKTVRSAQIHTQIRDPDIKIVHSANLTHTAQILQLFHKKLETYVKSTVPGFMVDNSDETERPKRLSYPSWCKSYRAGSEETLSSLMEKQLRAIPKVTPKMSRLIVDAFACPYSLLKWLRSDRGREKLSGVDVNKLFEFLIGK